MDKNPKYYEGVLQLRNETQEIVDFIANEMGKKGDVWIAKTKKHANGIDLFLSSNKFLKFIGKRLRENFPGELHETCRIHTRDSFTSKDVYGGCSLFRYCAIKKGDIIRYKGEDVMVISVIGKIFGKNLETDRKCILISARLSSKEI